MNQRAQHDGAIEHVAQFADVAGPAVGDQFFASGIGEAEVGAAVLQAKVIEEEIESVLAGKKAPQAAMDDAVKRGNEILRKFQAANKG